MFGSSGSRGFGELFGAAKEKLDNLQKDLGAILPSFPGMPVGKYGDLAIGVDVHSTVAPPSPSMPVPHVGAVFDIMGAIIAAVAAEIPTPEPPVVETPEDGSEPPDPPMSMGDMACNLIKGMAPSVKVHGKWIANAGTSIQHLPAIISHVAPVVAPMASSEMWMGSSTVLCDGSPFSTQAHPSLSCNMVGMPTPFRKLKNPKPKVSLMAPLAALTTITSVGSPVLVGGPPIIDLFQLAMSLGLKGLGKAWKKIGDKFQDFIHNVKNPKLNKILQFAKCRLFGEPVDAVTGRVFHENIDFELAGPIPLVWKRIYYSDAEIAGPLGYNWHHSYNIGIYDMEDSYTLRMADGREIALPKLDFGEEYYSRKEQLNWSLDEQGYLLEDSSGYLYRFGSLKNQQGYQVLSKIATKDGFNIQFKYDGSGDLFQIIDSRNRQINVDTDPQGRIRCISTFEDNERTDLVHYTYDANANMVATTDARGVSKYFEYEGHLLVKLTNQSGMSFYWQYQGKKDNAKCIHTWGDGGVLEYHTQYLDGLTRTTDSLGNTTEYYYDKRNLIYKIVDANGGITHQIYNQYEELEVVVDPEGFSQKSAFNKKGLLIKNTDQNDQTTHYKYDDRGNLTEVSSPSGVRLLWQYDQYDRVVERQTASGEKLTYVYDDKLLSQIVDEKGRTYHFQYNKHYELVGLIYPNGLSREWDYDQKGRLIKSKDVRGNSALFQYDQVDNLVWMQEPDGNTHEFEYDASFNLIAAKDKLHQVAFSYGAMGVLNTRTQNGKTIKFGYDKELQLRRIINEAGEQYRFDLDGLGQVVKETGFDGLQREYIRDGAGRLTEVYRPDNRWTKYKYDGVGNVIKEEHHDESWTGYKYNAEGLLVEAINEEGNIRFTRDKLGRITKEEHAGKSISRTYNQEGDCIHIGSSLGADIHHEYDQEGNLISLKSAEAWQADWQRDNTGLELYRQMTGGINIRTERDNLGRESRKTVGIGTKKQSQKQYSWGIGNRLQNIHNELKNTSINFEYDVFDNLIRADYVEAKEIQTIYRTPDAIGNYYQSPSQSDRTYAKGGKLIEDPTYHYHYDAEGNLIFKEFKKHQGFSNQGKEALEKKLKIKFKASATGWMYQWSANGMLQQVTNPEHGKIRFGYDPLGRRIFKETKKKRTNWLWDGNVPLHEWETQSTESLINVVTWIFESFELCAKITNDEVYSVISDYKKIPYLAINSKGKKIWEQELDIYGEVWTEKGEQNFIPMRFAGQYFDIETGLSYNRFRYYDPSTGLYISKDPLDINSRNYNFYSFVKDVNTTTDIFGIDWVYVLEDKSGKPYYTGRAAENETIQDVANRHSKTKGTKDGSRFDTGDKIKRKTSKDTTKGTTRGLEQRGIEERPLLGRQNEKVRGNKINGVSETKQKGKRAQNMVDADKFLKGKKVSELPTLEELSFDNMKKKGHSH